jgi:Fe-S-cluster-containing dehydrogenase component
MPPITDDPKHPLDPFDIEERYNPAGLTRRDFITLMSASMALAGLSGCRNKLPLEPVFSSLPIENEVAGRPRYFATTFPMPGFVQGVLVESNDGRPTKIEGNPRHPSSRGSTGLFAQASIIDLYSPARLSQVTGPNANTASLTTFRSALEVALTPIRAARGRGLAVLSGQVNSPTLERQRRELTQALPELRWFEHETISNANQSIGLEAELGYAASPEIHHDSVRCFLLLDCDVFGQAPDQISFPGAFMESRRKGGERTRLYSVDCGVTNTGAKADHCWRLTMSELDQFVGRLEKALESKTAPEGDAKFKALVDDLKTHAGKSAIIGGFALSPSLHARLHRLNEKLGNIGKPISYRKINRVSAMPLSDLATDLQHDQVKALIVLGGDPIYTSPEALGLASLFKKVAFSAHLSQYPSETSTTTKWTIPEAHFLETWSDVQSSDGTFSLVQPLLAPQELAVSAHDLLNWIEEKSASSYETVRATWRGRQSLPVFEQNWRRALADGICPPELRPESPVRPEPLARSARAVLNSSQPKTDSTSSGFIATANANAHAPVSTVVNPIPISPLGLEIVFRPDATIWDGRFGENPWLQELPKPPSGLCWDNALMMAPATAKKYGVVSGDIVKLKTAAGASELAVLILAGMPENLVTLSLGYGKTQTGELAKGSGFRASPLRQNVDEWSAPVLALEKTGRHYELAVTNAANVMGGRELIRSMTMKEASGPFQPAVDPKTAIGLGTLGPNIPAAMTDKKQQWAMSIDLDSCTGCSVCVIACQAENNIPIVGKKMSLLGRQMHWIRIDRYSASEKEGALIPLPVTCMHCETAPCEVVCPVGATNHSSSGLNQMVYNRCVGTRYCSNNCPYKVRRFNFFKFAENMDGKSAAQRNPEVTVRARGVMEKCTYCVQRIERARIEAGKEDRGIRDGEIRTACSQACPTAAITFGNLLDPQSRVVATRKSARTYGLLTELGTRPRTTYLATVINAHPGVEAKS